MTHSFHARSDSVQVDPSEAQPIFSEVVTQQYFSVALATALIYHSIVTMDREVKYFWPKPRNLISLIYFANRYFGILGAICPITPHDIHQSSYSQKASLGNFSFWTESICAKITVVLIDYILVIRVLALYQQNTKLAVCLKSLVGLEAALALGIFIYGSIFGKGATSVLEKGVTVCVEINLPLQILAIISWAIPLTFGLILLALALYKAAEYWRLSSGFKGFHLVNVLILDQVLYYSFLIFCSTLNMVEASISIDSPLATVVLSAMGTQTLLCIFGGQLLINLKEAGEMGANEGTNYRLRSFSDIDFAEGPGVVQNEQSAEDSVA